MHASLNCFGTRNAVWMLTSCMPSVRRLNDGGDLSPLSLKIELTVSTFETASLFGRRKSRQGICSWNEFRWNRIHKLHATSRADGMYTTTGGCILPACCLVYGFSLNHMTPSLVPIWKRSEKMGRVSNKKWPTIVDALWLDRLLDRILAQ